MLMRRAASGKDYPLIEPGDPEPFELLNPERATCGALLVCDHASQALPRALGQLGLDAFALQRHIAWDIGAGMMTRSLASYLQVPAVLAGYSRLVVDCNRSLDDPTAFRAYSDGDFVPGNHGLTPRDKELRAQSFYWPYHHAIGELINTVRSRRIAPAIIAIHSFTPFFNEADRPWQIGVLWDTDPRIPVPLMRKLRAGGIRVGDNQPYSGRAPSDFTIDHHAEAAGLPHASIEVRQDLIDSAAGVERWTQILGDALGDILAEPSLYQVQPHPE